MRLSNLTKSKTGISDLKDPFIICLSPFKSLLLTPVAELFDHTTRQLGIRGLLKLYL